MFIHRHSCDEDKNFKHFVLQFNNRIYDAVSFLIKIIQFFLFSYFRHSNYIDYFEK